MIYLGVITDREPIIPPVAPDHHICEPGVRAAMYMLIHAGAAVTEAGILPSGDIFDLEHLRRQLRIPILEWQDAKLLPSQYDTEDSYSTTEIEPLEFGWDVGRLESKRKRMNQS